MVNQPQAGDIAEFHWMLEMFQNLDVGLVVLDRDYRIRVWNSFMENHSGVSATQLQGENVFKAFPEVAQDWLMHKGETVFQLHNRAFTIWEQRPYLFKFKNYRPITGTAEFMYQNTTIVPLTSANGAVDHICLIVYDVTDIATSKVALEAANGQLQHLSRTDRLTELNNRGYWEECVIREYLRFQRTNQKVSLVMFDIDHFKKVNDTYGHPAGDAVIRAVAALLRKTIRATDIAGRYGGEEFGVVLVNTDAPAALYFSERLRKGAQQMTIEHEGRKINFTISLGISELDPAVGDHKEWIDRADRALYQSKQGGRNRATVFDPATAVAKTGH